MIDFGISLAAKWWVIEHVGLCFHGFLCKLIKIGLVFLSISRRWHGRNTVIEQMGMVVGDFANKALPYSTLIL